MRATHFKTSKIVKVFENRVLMRVIDLRRRYPISFLVDFRFIVEDWISELGVLMAAVSHMGKLGELFV